MGFLIGAAGGRDLRCGSGSRKQLWERRRYFRRLVLGEEAVEGKDRVRIPTFVLSVLTDILGPADLTVRGGPLGR